jgi:ATP-dependent Clp protease ATP-binding subunit ClpB
MERLKSYLSPEFLNRLDHTIVFHPLSKPLLAQIFKTQYADFSSHRSTREDVSVPTLSDARVDEIIEDIYDPELGARPIHRYIHQTIESEMIEKIMKDSD